MQIVNLRPTLPLVLLVRRSKKYLLPEKMVNKNVKIYLPNVDDIPLDGRDGCGLADDVTVEEWVSTVCQLKLGVTPGAWMVGNPPW